MKKTILIATIISSLVGFGQTEYVIISEDQTKLSIREFGVGTPVVLLAGGPGLNTDYLKPVWENLRLNFRCIVLDQRGTPNSFVSSVDSASMSMRNYLNDIATLQEHLNLERIVIVGHSWGGMLAMEYAAHHPKKVSKLILIGPGGPTGKFFSYFGDNIYMRLYEDDLSEAAGLDSMNQPTLKAIWPGYFYHRKMAIESKLKTDFDSMFGQPNVIDFTYSNYTAGDAQRIKLLKAFSGQVEIIQGRQDPIGESTVFEIVNILSQSNITFIEQCGHFPWLEGEEPKHQFFTVLNNVLH